MLGESAGDDAVTGAGRAYLVRGPMEPGTWNVGDAWATFTGEGPSALRHGAPAAGDLDGDGRGDLLVAAPYSDTGGAFGGEVYAFFGP